MKNKKLIVFITVTSFLLYLTINVLIPYAGKKGTELGQKYNLVETIRGEKIEFYLAVPAKAEEVENLTTEERFFKAIKEDANFRTYIVNMIVNNNNPGNLVFANQPHAVKAGRFAKFPDTITGFRALIMQLEADANRNDTIRTFLEDYAPRAENNTEQYITNVTKTLGKPEHTKLKDIDLLYLATIITKCEHSVNY